METLRGKISDAVNELNKLLLHTTDPQEEGKIRKLRRLYYAQWEEIIEEEIDSNTEEFKAAIAELKIAHDECVEAKKDIQKIAKAIDRAVSAAKAVDKIVKLGINLIA